MTQVRTNILKKVRDRVNSYYGPAGTLLKLFREVRRSQLRPCDAKPACTVVDGGQRRGENDDDESTSRVLTVQLYLHLAENWERQAELEEWSDNVELVIELLENWLPAACGGLKLHCVSDEPFDCVFLSGAQEALWMIEFEATYFVEAKAPDNWVP